MVWLILTLVVAFLIASALPLIREINDEKRRREAALVDRNDEPIHLERRDGDSSAS